MPKFQVERDIVIDAQASRVYDALADYRTWTTWSPWLIAEPETTVTISPNPNSTGSTYHWEGKITGEGELKHLNLEVNQKIEDSLTFLKPFKSNATTSFYLRPESGKTHVRWTMNSRLPWFLFWMVPMMKTFIGMDYARGLAMLKEWIETGTIQSKCIVHGVESVEPVKMAGIASSCSVKQVSESMDQAFARAQAEFKRLAIEPGEMISVYTKFRVKPGEFEYISGYRISDSTQLPSGSVLKTWSMPAGKAFRVEHIGSYRHLGNGWSVANQLVRHHKLKQCRSGTYEIYRTTPPSPEPDLVTDIYLPLK